MAGCHIAETPDTGLGIPETLTGDAESVGAGVDVFLCWAKGTHRIHALFVGYFLEEAYKQKGSGDYPTVDEALLTAYTRLQAASPSPDGDWNDPEYVWETGGLAHERLLIAKRLG